MRIGIPKETQNNEFRVALTPYDVGVLTDLGHEVYIEKNAGIGSGLSNYMYTRMGAKIVDNVYDCPMIVRVKAPPISTIHKNQIIMGYLHIEKGQNPLLLKALLDNNVTSYAYEEMRDSNYERLVNLGYEAGVVGMYEGLRLYGNLHNCHELRLLPSIWRCKKASRYIKRLSELDLAVAIMGNGQVSAGVQKVLSVAGIEPIILQRDRTPFIERYLPDIDILVNAVVWNPGEPQIVKRKMLKLMKPRSLIIDISCDENGAVSTCVPTTWDRSAYQVEGIVHMCIDNLPSAIPQTSSKHLSAMILPHVLSVANKDHKFRAGLMTKDGMFVYTPQDIETKNQFSMINQEVLVSE